MSRISRVAGVSLWNVVCLRLNVYVLIVNVVGLSVCLSWNVCLRLNVYVFVCTCMSDVLESVGEYVALPFYVCICLFAQGKSFYACICALACLRIVWVT